MRYFFSGARAQNADKMQVVHNRLTDLLVEVPHKLLLRHIYQPPLRNTWECHIDANVWHWANKSYWDVIQIAASPLAETDSPANNPSKKTSGQFGQFWDCEAEQAHFRFLITFYYKLHVVLSMWYFGARMSERETGLSLALAGSLYSQRLFRNAT